MLASLRRRLAANPWPALIFSTAFLVRLVYIIEKSINDPAFAYPMVDELWNWRWANEILNQSFWGEDAWFRAPLYPYFLALMVKFTSFLTSTGEAPLAQLFAIRTLQAALAAWTATLLYRLGVETVSHRVGAFAGLGYALYGALVFYETMLLIPVLFISLLVGATLQFVRWADTRRFKPLLYAGLLYGLAAIARPNILLVMPLLALFVFFHLREKDYARRNLVYCLKHVAVLTAAVCLPVFTVTMRNIIVTGEATLISTQGGVNFYLGNNSEADGLTMVLPEIVLDESVSWSQFTVVTERIAERESGRELTASEQSDFWGARAVRFIADNPGAFLALSARKIVYLTLGFENSDNGDIYFNRTYSGLMSALLWEWPLRFPWGIVFPLALIGMVAGWAQRQRTLPLYLIFLGYLPSIVLFLVTARHRTPLIPFVLIFAGIGVFYLLDKIRKLYYARFFGGSVSALALIIILNQNYFEIGFFDEGQVIQHQGITFERRQEWNLAEDSYRRALEFDPQSHVTWNALGFVLMRQNKIEEAAACFEKSTELEPNQIEALLNYGQMLARLASYEGALKRFSRAAEIKPNDFRPIINIGDIHLRQRQYDSAEVYYRRAKEIAPEEKEVYFKFGELYARQKKYDEADNTFRRGAFFGAPSAIAYLNWGNVRFETGATRDALAKYQQALRVNPRLKQAWYSAGMCHFKLSSPADSVRAYLNVALKLDPDMQQARNILEALDPASGGTR
ncbi:MAG: tetratricopeptide repeat protein [Candidatus Zixiibacteriota bacterium]